MYNECTMKRKNVSKNLKNVQCYILTIHLNACTDIKNNDALPQNACRAENPQLFLNFKIKLKMRWKGDGIFLCIKNINKNYPLIFSIYFLIWEEGFLCSPGNFRDHRHLTKTNPINPPLVFQMLNVTQTNMRYLVLPVLLTAIHQEINFTAFNYIQYIHFRHLLFFFEGVMSSNLGQNFMKIYIFFSTFLLLCPINSCFAHDLNHSKALIQLP